MKLTQEKELWSDWLGVTLAATWPAVFCNFSISLDKVWLEGMSVAVCKSRRRNASHLPSVIEKLHRWRIGPGSTATKSRHAKLAADLNFLSSNWLRLFPWETAFSATGDSLQEVCVCCDATHFQPDPTLRDEFFETKT